MSILKNIQISQSKLNIESNINNNSKLTMIDWLCSIYGQQKISYIIFAIAQLIMPFGYLFVNDHNLDPFQTTLLRGVALVIVNAIVARYYNMTLDLKFDINFNVLIWENGCFVMQTLALTFAQFYLPLPIVYTIGFLEPIFIFVIDYFVNKISITKTQFYCLLLSIIGIIVCINEPLVFKILDPSYQTSTEFKNYISLDPLDFSLYGTILVIIMFVYAYGFLLTRVQVRCIHIEDNFHMGLYYIICAGFLYPFTQSRTYQVSTLIEAFIFSALPLSLVSGFMVAGIDLNRKTGQIVVLTAIPVIVGYIISYYRYSQQISMIEIIGSLMILIGVLGVINCGQQPSQALVERYSSSKLLPQSNSYKYIRIKK